MLRLTVASTSLLLTILTTVSALTTVPALAQGSLAPATLPATLPAEALASVDLLAQGTSPTAPASIQVKFKPPVLKPKPSQPSSQQRKVSGKNVPGQFDYYVLALSWSPDFCASKAGRDSQCTRPLGFVLHGLWPQYTQGFPADCSTEPLPASLKQEFADLFPSQSLMDHEWRKHGTCSGLGARGYLQLAQQIKSSVVIPPQYQRPAKPFRTTTQELRQTLIQANPGLSAGAIAPGCSGSGRFLQEVRVCFAKNGSPMACGADVLKASSKSCAQPNFLVRNVR